MNFKKSAMIVCQALSCIGFGAMIVCIMILNYPGGKEMLALLFDVPNPPVAQVVVMTMITFLGSVFTSLWNINETVKNKKEAKI